MDNKSILLISYSNFEKSFLELLAAEVSREYRYPVLIKESHIDLADYYDPERRQYDGNGIIMEIESISSTQFIKKMGRFRVDLFIPILTYIFGQAILSGSSGIASIYRLRNEQYGMPANDKLMYERFLKVVMHETGHMFGLIHCHNPACVMRSSTYVEDIDQKGTALCSSCRDSVSH